MSGHNTGAVLEGQITRRGTSNSNDRGNNRTRRQRREYLVATYRADVDLRIDVAIELGVDLSIETDTVPLGDGEPCCRCYRCGDLLTVDNRDGRPDRARRRGWHLPPTQHPPSVRDVQLLDRRPPGRGEAAHVISDFIRGWAHGWGWHTNACRGDRACLPILGARVNRLGWWSS